MTVVHTDNLMVAAVDWLSSKSEITALVGSDAVFDTWIFQEDLLATVETTGKSAIVIPVPSGSWATPNQHNTMRFPRLVVEFYVDPPRDFEGNPTSETVYDTANHLYKVVDSYLHRPQGDTQVWGNLLVLDCVRSGELEAFPWGDVDKTQAYRINYNATVGD